MIEFSNVVKCMWGYRSAVTPQWIHGGALAGVQAVKLKNIGLFKSGG